MKTRKKFSSTNTDRENLHVLMDSLGDVFGGLSGFPDDDRAKWTMQTRAIREGRGLVNLSRKIGSDEQ